MQGLFKIAVLPGDGIGPEVTAEAVKVLKLVEEITGPRFRFHSGLIGGTALDATAVPLPAPHRELRRIARRKRQSDSRRNLAGASRRSLS